MTTTTALVAILVALLLGAMSPGPSFVLVSRLSVIGSRRAGVAAALGMGSGGVIFSLLALGGLITLLQQVDWLYLILKVFGGIYLIYLGIGIWRAATEPLHAERNQKVDPLKDAPQNASTSVWRSFWLGATTQIANPKTAVVYASIFAALLPANPDWLLLIMIPPAVFLVEAGWYTLVATLLSTSAPRRAYLRFKVWVDRVAGSVLGALGARLIIEEVH